MRRTMTATSRSSRPEVRTTDLTLASFLILKGHSPEMRKQGETESGWPIGAWVFKGGEELQGHVNLYSQGHAKVEPLAFHKTIKNVRRKMYNRLGIRQGQHDKKE